MDVVHQIKAVINPEALVQLGYLAIFLIIFAESGLFFGFFLPGDSLLILAGVAAAAGNFNIFNLIILVFIAAFLGDQVGYWMGNRFGRRLFAREDSKIFKKHYVEESEAFFAKHGHKAIVLARFVPIVRTFTPVLAGIGSMPYSVFFAYNLVGALLWGMGITLAGYFLANSIPDLEHYLNYIIGAIILISILPVVKHVLSARKKGPSGA
jgi:membrane-associated protein